MVDIGYQTINFADIVENRMSINRDDLLKTLSAKIIRRSMIECNRNPISAWEENLSENPEVQSFSKNNNSLGEQVICFSIPEASFSYNLTKKEGQILIDNRVADLYGLQKQYKISFEYLPSVRKFWEGIYKLRELPAKITELEAQYQHIGEYTRLYTTIKSTLEKLLYKPVYDFKVREWDYSMIEAPGKLPDFEYLYDNTPTQPIAQEEGVYCVSFYIDIYCVILSKRVATRIVLVSPDCDNNRLSEDCISDTLNSVVVSLDYAVSHYVDREINYHRTLLEKFQSYKENMSTIEYSLSSKHDEMKKRYESFLDTPLLDLDLSERTMRFCNDAELGTLRDLVSSNKAEVFKKMQIKYSPKHVMTELEELLMSLNLVWGMDCNNPILWTMDPEVRKIIIS